MQWRGVYISYNKLLFQKISSEYCQWFLTNHNSLNFYQAILQGVLEGQGLGRTGSSENGASSILGASVFVFIASLMIAMQF